jgi:hypothetical protein
MNLSEWSTVEYGEVQREEGREEGRREILNLLEKGYTAEQLKSMLASGRAGGRKTAEKTG